MAVSQLRVGEIVFAEQVDVGPGHGRVSLDGEEQNLSLCSVRRSEAHLEIEFQQMMAFLMSRLHERRAGTAAPCIATV